jgi:excisionase family DNA binding protein
MIAAKLTGGQAPAPVVRIAVKMPEAAAMLGVSTKTIRRAIQRGDIRVTRKFRHKLIPVSELERFINS